MSPVTGRIFGRLLICEPAAQSSDSLADYTGASKGAISTATRTLMQIGMVERVRIRGDRKSYYQLANNHDWSRMLLAEITRVKMLQQVANEMLDEKAGRGETDDGRLTEFIAFQTFFGTRLPALLEEWKALQGES